MLYTIGSYWLVSDVSIPFYAPYWLTFGQQILGWRCHASRLWRPWKSWRRWKSWKRWKRASLPRAPWIPKRCSPWGKQHCHCSFQGCYNTIQYLVHSHVHFLFSDWKEKGKHIILSCSWDLKGHARICCFSVISHHMRPNDRWLFPIRHRNA